MLLEGSFLTISTSLGSNLVWQSIETERWDGSGNIPDLLPELQVGKMASRQWKSHIGVWFTLSLVRADLVNEWPQRAPPALFLGWGGRSRGWFPSGCGSAERTRGLWLGPGGHGYAQCNITGCSRDHRRRQHRGSEGQAGVATSQLTQRTRVQEPNLRDQEGQALGNQPRSEGWVRLTAWRECLVCPNIHLKGRTLHGGTVTFTEPVFQVLSLD